MSKLEDNVNEILGIEKSQSEFAVSDFQQPTGVPKKIDESKTDIDNDYEYSRDSYYNLIDKGNEAIQGILDIAKEGQHPRAYEVAGQLIAQVGSTVDKLQDLQKKLKDLKELPKSANTNIKNALFVGSTNELQKMLRKESPETSAEKKKENEVIDVSPDKTDRKNKTD
jgi:hypothetical protein|tara:strand:- start:21 stop:524 length:504 start_codon:yes stop_codon:yes gene_type:complete